MSVDHEALLRRYIAHVYESEGSTFISRTRTAEWLVTDPFLTKGQIPFTQEEITELNRLEDLGPPSSPAELTTT